MAKRIQIKLSEKSFEELKEAKKKAGLTWKGMLAMGAARAEELGPGLSSTEAGKDEQ